MSRKPRRHEPSEPSQDCELVLACEAYLGGWYLEYLAAAEKPIPAWTWLNVIAHCDHERLEALASTQVQARLAAARARVDEWQLVLTVIARAVLEDAPDEASLRAMQASILVPLELRLIDHPLDGRLTADALAALVLSSLDRPPKPWRGCVEP